MNHVFLYGLAVGVIAGAAAVIYVFRAHIWASTKASVASVEAAGAARVSAVEQKVASALVPTPPPAP